MIRNQNILNKVQFFCSDAVMTYIWLFFRYAIAIAIFALLYAKFNPLVAFAFLFLVVRIEELEIYTLAAKIKEAPKINIQPLAIRSQKKEE